MQTVWTIIFVLLGIMWVMNRAVASGQRAQGHRRCAYCRARLRFMGVGVAGQAGVKAGYATTCQKCGQEQPWA
jgi:hypothetical protein